VRSADIDTIKKLAGQLANRKNIATSKMAWDEWTTALASAKALIEQQPAAEMHMFKPLFEPLFSKVSWGGIIRRESRTAADLLVRIGKPVVGFLLEKLKSTEARQRWSAIQILTEIGEPDAPVVSAIRPLLSDKDDYVRRVAIESLGKLGENARHAAEDLKATFNDTSVINQIFARATYIRIGHSKPEHIRAIAKYLESHDTKDEVGYGSVAAVAASVLGDLGPVAIIAAPDLTAALNHPQSQIRINAAGALGRIGADSNQAIDALIDRLKNDTSRQVRRSATASLGMIGRKAQDAIPFLAKVLREADKESRNDPKTDRTGWWVAARAVGQIGGANAIPVLEESLKNNDPDIRSTSAKALEKIQQEANTLPTPPSTQPVEKIGEPALANAAAKAMEPLPAQNSFRGITVSIRAKKSIYEPGSIFEIVGTISTDREHTMYNAYWDLKKPVPGRLFVYDKAGNQILEFYDPRHHIGSSTGATKSACRKYKPGENQQIFLRQYLLFDRSADRPLPPGRYKVQLALNGLLLWEPREYVAHREVPQELDQQMVAYSNMVHIEIEGEPAFQPKTLTQWIEALKHGSPKVRYSAAWTLREMKDPRAVASLIEALKDEDHRVRYLASEALAAIGKPAVDSLVVALKQKDTQVRICAARALERIADKRSMAPLIVALKEDQNRDVRSSAARALGNIKDKNAVPVLIEALRDKDIYPQITVCGALRKIGKPAIDGLIVHLMDTDDQARIRVVKALAEIEDKRSVEALVGALRDENPEVRNLAAHGLGRIKDTSAVPALIEALKADEVPRVRSSAARALGQTKGPGAVAALTAALKDKDVSTSARLALAEIGKPAVEHLIIALKDTDLQVRLSAAGALASIVDKKSVVPLIYALRDENDEVRVLAAETLGKLEDKRAVIPLTACLNDKDVRVRKEVILALGKIKDGRAVEPIIAILRDENPSIRSCAARGLGMIRDKRAVEPLIPLLKDSKDSGAAYYTAWALGEIGDKRAVEPLIACLNHELQHPPLLGKAAEALGKIKDERAVEPLMTALKVTRPRVPIPRHSDSSWAKPGDEAYLSLLIRILKDDYEARKYAVAWALVEIGQPAIGPLTHALQSDDKWLSGAAAVILEKIQASSATEQSTGTQSQQGKVEKQLAWLASEADLVVVAIKEQQIENRFEIKQILKGSGHGLFEDLEKIDGMDILPADETKQWIMFLRVEREHGRRLYPLVPTGWFVPYSKGLAQKIVEAIPLPIRWGSAEGGLRMGLRMRKTHFALGEEIPVEIHIQNVGQKNITLYQHLMPMYGYHPYTSFKVVTPDEKRWKLGRGLGKMSEYDFTPALELSPGETCIHTVRLNKWAVEREPLKPGEKFNLFTPGSHKITCTYSVDPKPDYIHPWNPPKNAWSGTLTSAPITLKIVEAKDASAAIQPTVTERYVLNDMTIGVRKEIEKLHSPDARIRALAAMALGEMGPEASPAIPHLIRLLGDQATFDHRDVWQKATFFTVAGRSFGAYVAADAMGALAKIGEPAVNPLIEALKDSDAFVRVHAARALERVQDKRAVEPLCEVLKDADENVRSAAAIALGQIGDGRAAKPLTELLADKAHRPRQDAIDALIKLDRPATKSVLTALRDWRRRGFASYILAKTRDPHAVEPLLDDLKDPNHNVRQGAAVGLGALGDRRAVKPLVKLLKDPNPQVRAASVQALGLIGEVPLEVYKKALQDEEPQVRINAAMALRRTKNASATEMLVKALKDENASVRNEALLAISIRDFRAVPAIIELLRDEDESIRTNAAFVLAKFKDQRAVKPLIKALKDKNYEVRARASYALGEIKDPRAVDVLCKALGDEKPEVRVRAAMALRNIGYKRAVVPLIEALKDPDWEVVIRTAEALGIIGYTQAVEPLISVLTDELKSPRKINIVRDYVRESTDDLPWAGTDMTVTLPVIAALGRLGNERATQPLLTALKDKRFQIRREAAQALGNIRAKAAVEALIAALKNEESSVRSSAAHALGQIKDPRAIEALIAASQDKEVSAYAISALRSITGHPDYTWEQWQRWWQKNRDKWKRSAKETAGGRIVKETVKYLQVDDKKVEVNWTLRVVTMEDYKSKWFLRRGDQEKEKHIASNITTLSEVHDIKAAPNGRYLAVLSVGEGHPILEVVDLPLLLKQKEYRVLRTINAYPGAVGINRWDKDRLIIDSDVLLTHIGENGRVHHTLAEMPLLSYALSIESGKVEALSEYAKYSVEYFSGQLFVEYAGERDNAAMALVALKAKSAIPALKKALAAETNPAVRAGMQKAIDELGKLPTGDEKPAAVLGWVDDETGQMLFTVRDIVRFDWEQQVFELSRRRAMDLLANQYGLSRPFRVYDSSGVIYRGTFVSSAASMTFDGPVIVVGSIIKNIQPPLYRIDGGYPQGPERDEIRFSERMKMALADAGVLCEIDLTKPPAPFTRIMSEWAGEKEGPRVLVELFPETFQIGEMARIHVHFVGGKHLSEDAHVIKVNATVKANNGEFEYTVQRIFPIGRDGWKKAYVLESMPWGPVLASPDAYAKPGPAEVSVQVSTKRTLYTKMGSYSDLIDTIKIRPMKVTMLPQDRD
ncbi:MAG: HEAT repeat domain-containing protein, partial [Planctomycetota bacterium]